MPTELKNNTSTNQTVSKTVLKKLFHPHNPKQLLKNQQASETKQSNNLSEFIELTNQKASQFNKPLGTTVHR